MSKLNRIQLSGFKSLSKIDLELRPLNLLIGANGAGKSNFIDFFRFMHQLAQQDLQFYLARQGGSERFLHFGRQCTEAIEIGLWFDVNHYTCTLVPEQTEKLLFQQESCQRMTEAQNEPSHQLANRGDKESGLSEKQIEPANQIASYLSDWQGKCRKYPLASFASLASFAFVFFGV
jgi:predicted ATPase